MRMSVDEARQEDASRIARHEAQGRCAPAHGSFGSQDALDLPSVEEQSTSRPEDAGAP